MLRQYQAVEIKEVQVFQNSSKSIATHANANIFLRFFENWIEVHTYQPNSTNTGSTVSLFRERDLLNETQRLAKQAQAFSIKTVFSQDCHTCLLISTNELFYIGIIYLPSLKMNQLKNLFFQMIPVLSADISRLTKVNQIAFSMRVHEEEKDRVMNISVLGYEDRSLQIEFFRISIGREAHFETFPLSIKYPMNSSLQNEKPIIKAFFFNKSNEFLVAVYEDIYRCYVKIKGGQKIAIEHIIVRSLNIKKIAEDYIKRGASQFASFLDIKASNEYGFFLIKYKDGINMQKSVKYGMAIVFFRLDSQDFRVTKQNFIHLKESAFVGGENCYLKLVHQQAGQALLAIKWEKEWRLISFADKDRIQLYSGKSQIAIINFLLINGVVRLIFKDRMAIVPINFVSQSQMVSQHSRTQRNEENLLERTLAQNLANSFQQNNRTQGIISRGISSQQKQTSNMILNNNNRLFEGVVQVLQAKSEDQDDLQDQPMQTPPRNRTQNNFTFQKQVSFHEVHQVQNNQPQHFNEEIQIPTNFAAQISFGVQQIIENNANNPGFHSPINDLNSMNPMDILASNLNQSQGSGFFSFSQKQIEEQNQSTAAVTPPSLGRVFSFGDKGTKQKQTVSPPPPVQPETYKQPDKQPNRPNEQRAPQYTVREQRPKYKLQTENKLRNLKEQMEKMIRHLKEQENKLKHKAKSIKKEFEQQQIFDGEIRYLHETRLHRNQTAVVNTFFAYLSIFEDRMRLMDSEQTQQELLVRYKEVQEQLQAKIIEKEDKINAFLNSILINPKVFRQSKKSQTKASIGLKFYKKIEDSLTHTKLQISNLRYEVEEIQSGIEKLNEKVKQTKSKSSLNDTRKLEELAPKRNRFEGNVRLKFKPFVVQVDLTQVEFLPLFNLS